MATVGETRGSGVRRWWTLAGAALVGMSVLVGCASRSSESADTMITLADRAQTSGESFTEAADVTMAAAAATGARADGDGSLDAITRVSGGAPTAAVPTAAVPNAAAGRMIIRTAQLSVEVADVGKAATKVQSIVTAKGGFVASQQGDYAGVPTLSLVLRVPATAFDATLSGLRGLGRLTNLSTASNEVTAQVVDLDSRLRTKRASADRLRTLLGTAAKAADLIEIERELSNREAEIESMQGQRNVLADQVSLSTITASLSATRPSDVRPPTQEKPSFGRGLRSGGRTIVGMARNSAEAAGALLPFVPLLVIAAGALIVVRRRHRRNRPIREATTPE